MSAALSESAYGGGGDEKGPLQQANPEAMLYMHNVAYMNAPAPAAYQQPAGGNAVAQAAAAAPAHCSGGTGSAEPFKRKRGRPRKYAPDDVMPLAVVLPSQTTAAAAGGSSAPDGAGAAPTLPPGFCPTTKDGGGASHPALAAASDAAPAKMGQPPGRSAKKLKPQRAPQAQGGLVGLKPHIFTVQAGEDVASRAMSFSCNGWAVCILSATGAVSNVTLRLGDSSGGTVTYEGRFEILTLAGSYQLSDSLGMSSRTGGFSVLLAGPDGRVLGGSVAGPLTAASPVQVVIGTFLSDVKKVPEPTFPPGRLVYSPLAPSSKSSPSSRGTLNKPSGGHGSPPNTVGSVNTSNQLGFQDFPPWK